MMNSICFSQYEKRYCKKCKNKKRKRKILSLIIVFLIIVISLFTYYFKVINPVVTDYCRAEINRILHKSSNNSINKVISQYNYETLVNINYNTNGDITAIYANQLKINELSNYLAIRTQYEIDSYLNLGIQIPIGTCTGISIFSGKGKNLKLMVNPAGVVKCSFKTSFISAGINQTRHKIYVDIESSASLILPFNSEIILTNTEFLISECLIVGKVPQTYFNITSLSDMYGIK